VVAVNRCLRWHIGRVVQDDDLRRRRNTSRVVRRVGRNVGGSADQKEGSVMSQDAYNRLRLRQYQSS
jgi:hypothetical protein